MWGAGPQMFGSLAGVTAVLNQLWGPGEGGEDFGCPEVPGAWCPSHRALSSPCCPCANRRGRQTLAGCGAPDGRAMPGCAELCLGCAGCGALGHGTGWAGGCPCCGMGAWGLPCFINTQLPLRARTKPDLWRPSINYNILGTVISTSGLLNFVLIGVSLFLSQHFFPSAGYRSFLCGDLTNC